MPQPERPWVTTALLCERIDKGKAGDERHFRDVTDGVVVPTPIGVLLANPRRSPIERTLVISIAAPDAIRSVRVAIDHRLPDDRQRRLAEESFPIQSLPGGLLIDRKVKIDPVAVGTHWFIVSLDGAVAVWLPFAVLNRGDAPLV